MSECYAGNECGACGYCTEDPRDARIAELQARIAAALGLCAAYGTDPNLSIPTDAIEDALTGG